MCVDVTMRDATFKRSKILKREYANDSLDTLVAILTQKKNQFALVSSMGLTIKNSQTNTHTVYNYMCIC